MGKEIELRRATKQDLPGIHLLLRESGLPVPGPADPAVAFVAAARAGEVLGCAGWELHGSQALLRSVAVRATARGTGLGRRLVEKACAELAVRGVRDVTLVTLSAAGFFARFGFEKIARDAVPEAVRASPEFGMHCCEAGTWMRFISPKKKTPPSPSPSPPPSP